MMRLISILSGLCLIAVMSFTVGMWTTHKNWTPWQTLDFWKSQAKSFKHTGMFLREGSYVRRSRLWPDTEYAALLPEKMAEGNLLIVKLILPDDRFEAQLLDPDGKVLNRWVLDYSLIEADGNPGDLVHAAQILPDGSIVVTFDEAHGLARFDACSNVVWSRNDRTYHHSLAFDDDGTLWTWAAQVWAGGHDQAMVRFDPETGEIVEEINMIDDVVEQNAHAKMTLTFPEGFEFDRLAPEKTNIDFLHPNDLEPLTEAMADAFPMFNAGDLLVSLRNINGIAVIDRETHEVKWIRYGPWRDQHDPDFEADGTITIFSNNRDRERSTILQIDPATDEVRDVFEGSDLKWDSYIMGKHQSLPNGNWLIVSAMQGRIVEATPDGQIVREVNNIINEDFNAIMAYGEVIPPGYLDTLPKCN